MDGIWGGSPLSKGESSLKEIAVGMWLPIGIQKSVQVVWCMGGYMTFVPIPNHTS